MITRLLKKKINKLFSTLGYTIIPNRAGFASLDNFINLSKAYEQLLNELRGEKLIVQDEIRPLLLARLLGTPPSEAYFIVEALVKTKLLGGDVCEFGVGQGQTTALIANEIRDLDNTLHVFDSFEGLPKPSEKDKLKDDILSLSSMEAYSGTMSAPEEMVISRLRAISFPSNRYFIHKGFIEEVIGRNENLPVNVSFAYVDFDLYEPIKFALNYLHSVTSKGSIIIVDDYDYFSTGGKTAVDEFVEEKNSINKVYDTVIPAKTFGHFAILTKRA